MKYGQHILVITVLTESKVTICYYSIRICCLLQTSSERLQKPIPASHMALYEIFNNQIEKGRSRLTNPV